MRPLPSQNLTAHLKHGLVSYFYTKLRCAYAAKKTCIKENPVAFYVPNASSTYI